jgi:hypothetical protein
MRQKESKKSVKSPQKNQKSPCFKASTRTWICKCGSKSGPGIKIWAGSGSRVRKRPKMAWIQTPLLFYKPQSAQQLCYTGEKLSYYFSVELFEFLALSKVCFTYDGLYNCVKK